MDLLAKITGLESQLKLYRGILQELEKEEKIQGKHNIFYKFSEMDEANKEKLLEISDLEKEFKQLMVSYAQMKFGKYASRRFLEVQAEYERYVYTVIKVERQAMAVELMHRIKLEKECMHNLAQKYSLGPEKHTKGILGPLKGSQLHPIIRTKLKQNSLGEVIEPFKVKKLWLVIRKEAEKNATLDEGVKSAIECDLLYRSIGSI